MFSLIELEDENKIKHLKTTMGFVVENDKTLKKEIQSIEDVDFMTVQYNAAERTIQIQSELDEDLSEKYKKTVRKKSWPTIRMLFTAIMRADPKEVHKAYEFVSNSIVVPRQECYIRMFYRFMKQIAPVVDQFAKDTIGDLDIDKFDDHIENISVYRQLVFPDDGIRRKPQKSLSADDLKRSQNRDADILRNGRKSSDRNLPWGTRDDVSDRRDSRTLPFYTGETKPTRSPFSRGRDDDRRSSRRSFLR
jgi:hypothetical protein